ncbi:MAG: GNAT family N-acetyltransferase [Thermotogae bacterium]|nr:GNAT family N-acetyltransferase [Thermotogota bacterium]
MKKYFVFDRPDIRKTLLEYIKKRYAIVEVGGNLILRKVGKVVRLEYAIQDVIDWWDMNLEKDELLNILEKNIYFRVVLKNLLEFGRLPSTLNDLPIRWRKTCSKVFYVPLRIFPDFYTLRKSFSKNVWKNVRNSKNRLKRLYGSWRIERCHPVDSFSRLALEILVNHPTSKFKDPLFVKTMAKVIEILYENNLLTCWKLYGGEETLATNYIIESEDLALSFLASYIRKAGDVYRLLIFNLIRHYHTEGFSEFNFMKGESPYKKQWTDHFYRLYRYEAFHPNPLKRVLGVIPIL